MSGVSDYRGISTKLGARILGLGVFGLNLDVDSEGIRD